jgi:hypothetical protein
LTLELSLKIDAEKFRTSFEALSLEYDNAFETSKNMIASMIRERSQADIMAAGNFGPDFVDALRVEVDGDTIRTTLDAPGANIFEEGGTIHGDPLLWLPISGTDAVGTRAREYGHGLFSVNRKAGGPPLLFSVEDRQPKYFGIPSVFIAKKFHLREIQTLVLENFKTIFEDALNHG